MSPPSFLPSLLWRCGKFLQGALASDATKSCCDPGLTRGPLHNVRVSRCTAPARCSRSCPCTCSRRAGVVRYRCSFLKPGGRKTIAQRFNAGDSTEKERTPQGRKIGLASFAVPATFCRPCGTLPRCKPNPAMNRWAIFGHPCGTKNGSRQSRHGGAFGLRRLDAAFRFG